MSSHKQERVAEVAALLDPAAVEAEQRGARNALAAVQATIARLHREQCAGLREHYDAIATYRDGAPPFISFAGVVRLRTRGRLLEELSREVERLAAGAGGTGLEVSERIDHIVRDRARAARGAR